MLGCPSNLNALPEFTPSFTEMAFVIIVEPRGRRRRSSLSAEPERIDFGKADLSSTVRLFIWKLKVDLFVWERRFVLNRWDRSSCEALNIYAGSQSEIDLSKVCGKNSSAISVCPSNIESNLDLIIEVYSGKNRELLIKSIPSIRSAKLC